MNTNTPENQNTIQHRILTIRCGRFPWLPFLPSVCLLALSTSSSIIAASVCAIPIRQGGCESLYRAMSQLQQRGLCENEEPFNFPSVFDAAQRESWFLAGRKKKGRTVAGYRRRRGGRSWPWWLWTSRPHRRHPPAEGQLAGDPRPLPCPCPLPYSPSASDHLHVHPWTGARWGRWRVFPAQRSGIGGREGARARIDSVLFFRGR